MFRLRGGGGCLLQKKCIKKKRNGGRGEESRLSGHKLNITDGFTTRIILSSIPLIIMSVKYAMSPYELPF